MYKQIFITGTDTNVGKTLVASWLCLHSNYDYFKPIQTGAINQKKTSTDHVVDLSGIVDKQTLSSDVSIDSTRIIDKKLLPNSLNNSNESMDSYMVKKLSPSTLIHPEIYVYEQPVAPYLAASLVQQSINLHKINFPQNRNIIIEGAGGLLVPINSKEFILDLIIWLKVPVILVARTSLGTINHSLLSIEMLRSKGVKILGVIFSGHNNTDNVAAIATYGKVSTLAVLPHIESICKFNLAKIGLSAKLKEILAR